MAISIDFFKRILKTSQVVISTNPNDLDEESARYRMDTNGDLYQLNAEKRTEKFLFNIKNEKKLTQLYDNVLSKVVSFSYTGYVPTNEHFDKCGTQDFNGKTYITRSVTLWKGTEHEVEYNFAEENLGFDLANAESTTDPIAETAWRIDEQYAAFPPYTWLTDLDDDELAERIQEEFYDNEPD